eukprot:scaffold1525_cov142-Cylindrotheca_fusiformis.AAC.181
MPPAVSQNTSMENHQSSDMFSPIESQNESSDQFSSNIDDAFNESGNDFLSKMFSEDSNRNMPNMGNDFSGLDSDALLQEALNRSNASLTSDMLKDGDDDVIMDGGAFDKSPLFGNSLLKSPDVERLTKNDGGLPNLSGFGGDGNAIWGSNQNSAMSQNINNPWNPNISGNQPLNAALEATPLNLSLGGGGGGSALPQGPGGANSFASMLRKKPSNTNLKPKFGSVVKASRSSSKMRSNKSDGLLARAFKQKYNSSSSLSKFGPNASGMDISAQSQMPRNAVSAFGAPMTNPGGASNYAGDNSNSMQEFGGGENRGAQNASWGAPQATRSSGSDTPFSKFLAENSSSNKTNMNQLGSGGGPSQSSLQPSASFSVSSKSSSTMQDALRMYKRQSKTQSALRQSSQQSLWKHTHSKSFSGSTSIKSLLPPQHTAANRGTSGNQNYSFSNRNIPSNAQPVQTSDAHSLLHQSCRLYPTTAAVVESALRIDPDAVRKPITPQLEKGQAKKVQNTYGYPVNVALSHGGNVEVIKMLAEAAPEILLQKDGSDGSGSLGIALMAKQEWPVVALLLKTNIECIKISDRRGNFPLHVAANHGIALGVVRKLYRLYPKALQMRNFHSETPLDIAQRSARCPEEVINFLQTAAFSGIESAANRLQALEMDDIMNANL